MMVFRRLPALTALACLVLCCAPARGEDIPAFEKAFGQPAIVGTGIAVDDSRIYVGNGPEVTVLSRDGEWLTFWPISSAARGVGSPVHPSYPYSDRPSQVVALSAGPTGRVYVADSEYLAIHAYTSDGQFLLGWGGPGDPPEQFSRDHLIWALSVAPDSSVYVLDNSGSWDVTDSAIRRYDADGVLLGMWSLPGPVPPYTMSQALDIAAAADGGVWVLLATYQSSGCFGLEVVDARIYRYAPDGTEMTNLPLPTNATRIAVDPQGDVWVLEVSWPAQWLQRYNAAGEPQGGVDPGGAQVLDFTFGSDGKLYVLADEWIPGIDTYIVPVQRVQVYDASGSLLRVIGDYADLRARGAIIEPEFFAVTPEGQAYIRTSSYMREDLCYISHFDAEGRLAEVIGSDAYPIYNPQSGKVDLDAQPYDAVDGQGNSYTLAARPDSSTTGLPCWAIDFVKYRQGGAPAQFTVITNIIWDAWSNSVVQPRAAVAEDGNLRVALDPGGTLWVGTVSPDGELLNAWTDPASGSQYVNAIAVDPADNVYLGGQRDVWKYTSHGERLGRIGGWGGEGDQRDALGSLVQNAVGLSVDAIGRLRVLDGGANRVLVFRYRPGPFSDIPWYFWAKDAVQAAVDAGVVAGYPDKLYHPEITVTRDQMAVFIARGMVGGDDWVPTGSVPAKFQDVPTSHWAYDYIQYCGAAGIVQGYTDNEYRPDLTVDRAQMAVFIARAIAEPTGEAGLAGYTPPNHSSFPDVPTNFWAFKYVEYAKEKGVVVGYPDGLYHPEITITRDQMAVYVARAFGLMK
jgi:hypothetical protein